MPTTHHAPPQQQGQRVARARRHLITTMIAVLSVAAALLIGAPAANAATGNALTGLDPYATGCASNGAFVVNSAPMYVPGIGGVSSGTAYLWYSNGCGTNWTTVTSNVSNPDGAPAPIVTNVYRQTPYNAQTYTYWGSYVPGSRSWSNMVYAPTSCAKGFASIDVGFGNARAWVYQNSCRF